MESSEQEIINRILNDAKEEADFVVKKAEESAQSLLEKQRQQARKEAEKNANTILKRAANDAAIIRGKTVDDIRRQATWSVLSEKNRLLQTVLDKAKQKLLDMKKTPKYVVMLETLTVDAASVLGGGQLTVHLNDKDSTLKLDLEKAAKEVSARTGVKTNLSISEEPIADAGVVVKTLDGKVFVDNTFGAILRRREKELKIEISKILFGSVDG